MAGQPFRHGIRKAKRVSQAPETRNKRTKLCPDGPYRPKAETYRPPLEESPCTGIQLSSGSGFQKQKSADSRNRNGKRRIIPPLASLIRLFPFFYRLSSVSPFGTGALLPPHSLYPLTENPDSYKDSSIRFSTTVAEISRLAASGITRDCGLSITSSVTIMLRRTGKQCMK